jgi:putative ABC transport system permease protein
MKFSLFVRLSFESVVFALQALWLNKLRTFLSVLAITVGIYAIILVFTVTDSMQYNIKSSFESLGSDVIFVQKWPWEFGSDYPWWKYMNRPNARYNEQKQIAAKLAGISESAYTITMMPGSVKFASNSVSGVAMAAVSHQWNMVRSFEIAAGRYFTEEESAAGRNVVIIGDAIANGLFDKINPIGRIVRIKSKKLRVIGVFKQEGESLVQSASLDNQMIVPINYARNVVDVDDERLNPTLLVKAIKNISLDEVEQELKGSMRNVRKLKPGQDDNFALNRITMITKGLEQFFGVLSIAGWVIGGFSILVGGFGIANIMFVSVKERTNQIGIQKSLGAKRSFILTQFLAESVTLTLLGGLFGILGVFGTSFILTHAFGFNVFVSFGNFMLGTLISVSIGIIFGILPAWSAARLNPVEAIRSNM